MPAKKKLFNYSERQMEMALGDVSRGIPIATAAKSHGVPRMTLSNKAKGKSPSFRKMGPDTVLTKDEESILVTWILKMSRMGFPITKEELLDSVQQLIRELKRKNPFSEDRPTLGWLQRFKNRHPEISIRTAQNLTVSRASVTKMAIRNWFQEVNHQLETDGLINVLSDPTRVFNGDESAFFLNPKGNKVLAGRGQKSVYQQINSDEKECLTVLVTANAAGNLAPPMVIFKYDRVPRDIANSVPDKWGIGKSESGWMNGATFFEYISNIFYPFLIEENITRPIILFIDGHVSHLTLHTSRFCSENGIILVALYPNATQLIQPMDVAVFRTLKEGWKQKVHQWRNKNLDYPILRKKDFCPLLQEVLQERITDTVLKNGFRRCGLVPWDYEAIQFPKEAEQSLDTTQESIKEDPEEYKQSMKVLNKILEKDLIEAFNKTKIEWQGDIKFLALFEVYKKIKDKCIENKTNINDEITHNEIVENDTEVETSLADVTETSLADVTETNIETFQISSSPKKLTLPNLHSPAIRNIASTSFASISDENHLSPKAHERYTPENAQFSNEITPDTNNMAGPSPMENQTKINQVKKKLVVDGQIIPTPFKKILHWPEAKEKGSKKRKREKIPYVASSKQWQEYHLKKEKEKLEKENAKKLRLEDRLKKKQEKEQLKQIKAEKKQNTISLKITKKQRLPRKWSESETEEEWVESGSSGDDLGDDISDSDSENMESTQNIIYKSKTIMRKEAKPSYKKGDFVLIEFPGDLKSYRYVCILQEILPNDEFEVIALKSCNDMNTIFKLDEYDISVVGQEQILNVLDTPSVNTLGDRIRYEFQSSIDVDGYLMGI